MPDNGLPDRFARLRRRLESWWSPPGGNRRRKVSWTPKQERIAKIALLVILSLLLAFLLTHTPRRPPESYTLGSIAQENVRAVGDFLVEDVEATHRRQQEVLASLPPVYELDDTLVATLQERLHRALEYLRQASREIEAEFGKSQGSGADAAKAPMPYLASRLLERKSEFDRLLGVSLPQATFQLLVRSEFSPALESLMVRVLEEMYKPGIIDRHSLPEPRPREILLKRRSTGEGKLVKAPFPFMVVDQLRKPMVSYCREVAADFTPADRLLVCDVVQYLVVPNITYNAAATQELQRQTLKNLKPIYFQVKKGELILREGERLTPLHLAKLAAQHAAYTPYRSLLIFLGHFLSLVLILWLAYNLARISLRNFSTRFKDLLFLAVLILVSLLLNEGIVGLATLLNPVKPLLADNLVFALPIALAPICATLFLRLETGLALAFLMAVLSTPLLPKPFPLFFYLVAGSLMGVWGVRFYRRRQCVITAGLLVCGVNILMVTAFKFLEYPFTVKDLLLGQAMGFTGGLLTGMLALGFTPIIESVFGYTSNIRLVELLNLDQPLLKELLLVAPGTYHHSLVVGQMVEASAEAIGANPLLAKAAAYYHDIGKIKKPAYFVENQFGGENKHEKLAPSMSSLILISHVKDGVELARKHKLGDAICDIIQQHHGTCLINYFYAKAKNQAPDPSKVNIDDFRYPGPRPQTKEAGLVLVADQVEAASKTLTDPTPARIQGMVQKIINNIFADGQLEECDLTLKELNQIAKHCTKILSGIFHHRVHYPTPAEKVRVHEDLDKQPPKKNGLKAQVPARKNQEDLKRLGMG